MINEDALKDALLALAQAQKTQCLSHAAALCELAALRETVKGLDPTFSDVIEQKRKEQADATKDIVSRQAQLFDAVIHKLNSRYIC